MGMFGGKRGKSPAGIMRAKRGGSVGRACGAGAYPRAPVSAAEARRGGGGGAHEREKRDTNISGNDSMERDGE
jgi:hypothetical protein